MIEPVKIAAGDSLNWERSLEDYLASEGYTLHYALFNAAASFAIDSTADGDKHVISVDSATTAAWAAGRYDWVAYITGPGGIKKTLFDGSIKITPDLTAAPYDGRSHAQKMLEAIEACLEERGTAQEVDLVKAQFGERAAERNPESLRAARDGYKAEVAKENRGAARGRGEKVSSNSKITFTR